FREITIAVDALTPRQPFVFPPDLYRYVFAGITGNPQQTFKPDLRQVSWQGQFYSYYQDPAHRQLFYYLPDSFKLVRRPEAPHHPMMSIQFIPTGDANEDTLAVVEYWAFPALELKRLEESANELKKFVPNLDAEGTIEFQPLLAGEAQLTMHLPQADGSQLNQARPEVMVDLRTGFRDSLTLSLKDFQRFYDAIFGGSSVLFQGAVNVTLPDRSAEVIPFTVQMDDLVGDLLSYEEVRMPDSDSIQATLINAIESPLQINHLPVILYQDGQRIPAQVEGLDLPSPIILKPGESIRFTVKPATALPKPAAEFPIEVLFELDQVQVVPDKEAIWDAILRPDTPAEYQRAITVKTFKEVFGNRLTVISIDFRQGGTVDFIQSATSEKLESEVAVVTPIRNLVLRTADQGAYDYRVLVIRNDGQKFEDADWRTDVRESLWITNAELPATEDR
ncbi:MAG: hypothetical protein F6K42_30205, partial [Leptolyngbya sp. SIO1D8]|nr:hypothetical protein [Leptolyngbya sp. SIO1D8]